jgi:hypothetical protein
MDVTPLKPLPAVQPSRKIDRERHEREREQKNEVVVPKDSDNPDDDNPPGIDTYA